VCCLLCLCCAVHCLPILPLPVLPLPVLRPSDPEAHQRHHQPAHCSRGELAATPKDSHRRARVLWPQRPEHNRTYTNTYTSAHKYHTGGHQHRGGTNTGGHQHRGTQTAFRVQLVYHAWVAQPVCCAVVWGLRASWEQWAAGMQAMHVASVAPVPQSMTYGRYGSPPIQLSHCSSAPAVVPDVLAWCGWNSCHYWQWVVMLCVCVVCPVPCAGCY
jgi:hypothetical protein